MNTELKLGGIFTYEHIRNGKVIDTWQEKNLVVDEGLEYVLGNAFDGVTSSIGAWYVGLFTGNFTPLSTTTAASIATDSTETTTQYSEATRPAWVEANVISKARGNSASPAVFTFTPASTPVYGAFLVSDSSKGGTSGVLAAASRFASLRTMLAADVLNVTYNINVAAA